MTQLVAAPLADGLAALLRGESVSWAALDVEPGAFLTVCVEEDLAGLVHRQLAGRPSADWPPSVREELEREARAEVMREALRRRELMAVLDALAAQGIRPILLKGAPLAYTVYEEPGLRPRGDTDLLIRREEREDVRRVMSTLGYGATNYSDGEFLFHQFEMAKDDTFGVSHALDFHWKISTESVFADLLDYEELAGESVSVPALGPQARGAKPVHALLLACVHPAMHHRSLERLIWLYDIHLLASRLSSVEFDGFACLAVRKGVAAICLRELELARARLGTGVPADVVRTLAAAGSEPSAAYLEPERRWSDELVSNVRGLQRWSDRLRLLREVAFPAPRYMLRAYRLDGVAAAGALLPALYVHRGLRGIWKVLRKRK
ncbi:MAG: nucleotidyltransferase family protein [Gemmatimonadales bacterium]